MDTITSSAIVNKDKSSAKQLRWERKRELKEILEKKKNWKRKNTNQKGKKSKKFRKDSFKNVHRGNKLKK